MYIKPTRLVRILFFSALGIAALWILPFLLPVISPFVIAFAAAAAMEPLVRFLSVGAHLPRAVSSGIVTIFFLAGAGFLIALIGGRTLIELGELASSAPDALRDIMRKADGHLASLRPKLEDIPGEAGKYATALFDSLPQHAAQFAASISGRVFTVVSSLAGKMPRLLLFGATTGLGIYFISSEYPKIKTFISLQIPERWRAALKITGSGFISGLGSWMRAQLILTLITFGQLLFAFTLLGVPYSVATAALTALVDLLPVLGTGTVLIPWALFSVLSGSHQLGAGLAITYGAVTLLRNLIQAKLLGGQMGLHPVISLAAVYIGFCAMGVWGMILLPIIVIILKQLNDKGVIRLWRSRSLNH